MEVLICNQLLLHVYFISALQLIADLSQVIGVGASVAGDMASRPNWGLNELDFVFATLVVSKTTRHL